jgi:hypothetical protein
MTTTATARHLTPSAVASELPTASRTPTRFAFLSNAGLVEPSFEVQFLTSLQDLPTSEYLLVQTRKDPDARHRAFSCVSLDGQIKGLLLTMVTPADVRLFDGRYNLSYHGAALELGSTWDNDIDSGVVLLDLVNQQIRQFHSGCKGFIRPSTLETHYFTIYCDDNGQQGGVVQSFFSTDSLEITSYALEINKGSTELRWITYELAWVGYNINTTVPPEYAYCLLDLARSTHRCFRNSPHYLYPLSAVSPDGNSIAAYYVDSNNSLNSGTAILPVDCLENPEQSICLPEFIDTVPTGSGLDTWGAKVYWAPDGETILFINELCPQSWETNLWIYDIEQKQSKLLATYPDCIYKAPGPWTADGEHFLIVDENPSDNQTIWLVSSVTGQMQRVAANVAEIVDVVGLFRVP